ncbi:hypothetical protein K432DRAFT_414850 [Lepidopterella palustris CBS 459.81]|uniref:BCAS2 family protein n=1 Tax=Lepidopterella palustris CBS 459.81 TaxID=1314670 RepID=A0A8E2EGL5_9PEZI|nr:hypothetical protein K432DRAFT_414850 [Lepidopterella palustris CBS 459.81]
MPLINESYDSLPYIDTPPTDASLTSARALVDSDISSAGIDTSVLHPSLIPSSFYVPKYSDALESEHARLAADPKSKITAIDLSRYEALEAPPNTNPSSDENEPEILDRWNDTLKKAFTSSEYLNARLAELGLLETFGKNAWLIGNSQLESILKALEAELAETRTQTEAVEEARRTQQNNVRGEMQVLEETWKRGIGRVLETEVAAEGLRQEILTKRSAGAV